MPTGGGASRRGKRRIPVDLPKLGDVPVYANARVADALEELSADMGLYHGVRLGQVMEALYEQGRIDGRREVFTGVEQLKQRPELRHRNPGRPRKSTTAATAKKAAVGKKAGGVKKAS